MPQTFGKPLFQNKGDGHVKEAWIYMSGLKYVL